MTTQKQALGQWGEEIAAGYLESKGYTILARNIHTAHGEIDIVASKESAVIFVEVKTRSSHAFAYPEDSVTRRKQAAMLSAAVYYLQKHPESAESWQFDVIAIERKNGGKPEIVHFENVIG
ncbi:MAG: YraN family protein [Anaerolineales bacterium]|jgi:putative endonuclease